MNYSSRLPRAGNHKQAGVTLIEVLVTLVLISVGLLGVAALQLTSLKSNQEAYSRSQASVLAGNILDRMRTNQRGVEANEYATAMNGTGTANTVSGGDLAAWQAAIDTLLPGGGGMATGGQIDITGNRLAGFVVTVTIQWTERADRAANVNANQTVTFQTRTEI